MLSRRIIIYFLLLSSILIPLIGGVQLPAAINNPAKKTFDLLEHLPQNSNSYAVLFFDYGPGTQAENDPQAQLIVEHLLRRKIPVVVLTTYALSEKFTTETPRKVITKLQKEDPTLHYEYGKDYVVLGYRPGAALFLQALSKAKDLGDFLGKDIEGQTLAQYDRFKELKTVSQVSIVGEFTGLVGFLSSYIQYLIAKDAPLAMIHGCTSITIPETYNYTDSGQLKGVLEGVAGAAYYSALLREKYNSKLVDDAVTINSALGFGQLMILALIVAGNLIHLSGKKKGTAK